MKQYTIQEFADLSGVSVDRLRHYEKLNLMTPKRDLRNGYRYYSDEHLLEVHRICFMQSLNVPLKKIPKAKDTSNPCVSDRIAQRIGELEEEISRLRLQKDMLSRIRRESGRSDDEPVSAPCLESRYVLFYDQIRTMPRAKAVIAQWMRYAPLVYPVFEIDLCKLGGDQNKEPDVRIGLSIEKRYAAELGFDIPEMIVQQELDVQKQYMLYLGNPLKPQPEDFADLVDAHKKNGDEFSGKLSYRICGRRQHDRDTEYCVQVYIPITLSLDAKQCSAANIVA